MFVESIPSTIKDHIGHKVNIVTYGKGHNDNASIECENCYEILAYQEEIEEQ
jgi:hypothetical protein